MLRQGRFHLRLILGLLLLVHGGAVDAADPSSRPEGRRFKTVARWYGDLYARRHHNATREPGAFGLRFSSPNSVQVTRANVVLREEIDEAGIETRTVVESIHWTSTVSELYYQNKDGSRVGAGSGGTGGANCSESQLFVVHPARPESLKEIQERIEKARADVAKWEQEKAKAEAAGKQKEAGAATAKDLAAQQQAALDEYNKVMDDSNATDGQKAQATARHRQAAEAYRNALAAPATPDRATRTSPSGAQQMIEKAKRELNRAQYDLVRAREGTRMSRVHADAAEYTDAGTKKLMVRLDFSVPSDSPGAPESLRKLFTLNVDLAPLEASGPFGTKVGSKYEPTRWSSGIPGFSGKAEIAEKETVLQREVKGSDGQVVESGTFRRVAVREQLVVRGKVLHRVRIPRSSTDKNTIVAPITPQSLEGAVAVSGSVRVEAWLLDPNLREEGGRPVRVKQPPIQVTQTRAEDGEFELTLPPLPERHVLRLEFTYHNQKAQITETQRIEMSTGPLANLVKAAGEEGWSAEVDGVGRVGTCYVRYERKPRGKEMPLGYEDRGAELRRKDGAVTLNFDGVHSILINTFCMAAPYFNQHKQGFTLQAVVPSERLLAAIPWGREYFFSDEVREQIRARLPNGGRDPEGRTDVKIRGTVVCFPTCQAMILGGLGVEVRTDPADPNPVKSIAQGIYDDFYETNKGSASPWKFPFRFPFPEGKALGEIYAKYYLSIVTAKDALKAFEARKALAKSLHEAFNEWPYVDADQGHRNKTWLITVAGAGHRPWQAVENIKKYLEKAYPVEVSGALAANVFDFGESDGGVLRALGRGSVALVSIRHRDSGEAYADGKPREGGHGIVLLGAVVDKTGRVLRLILHDPYGDQTQHPKVEGYYAYDKATEENTHNPNLVDYDRDGTRGAYVPYGPEVDSYQGRLEGKFWVTFTRSDAKNPTPGQLRPRLLPSEPPKE